MDDIKKVPVLRFPEFSGKWESMAVHEMLEPVSKRVTVEDNKLYQQIGIRSHGKGIFHKDHVSGKSLGNKRVFWIRENLFVVNIVFAWEKAVAKTSKNEIGMIASHRFPMYQPLNNLCTVDFILLKFLTKKGTYLLELASPGGAGRNKTLGQGEFKKIKISIPSIPEQQKIANFLTQIDSKIEKLTKKKQLLERYKKAMIQKFFSQQLRFKDDEGSDYPDWEVKRLGNIFSIKAGGDIDNNNVSKIKTSEFQYPIYANSGKNRGLYGYSNQYKIDEECVTVTGRGSLGMAVARFEKFYPIVRLLILIPKIKLDVIFYENVINKINFFVESTGVPQPTSPQISVYKVLRPSIQEQTKIANCLTQIDKKINTVDTQLNHTKQFKKGLLQQLFV